MWYITAQSNPRPVNFLLNRITRIYPLYWLFTAAMVCAAIVIPKAFRFAYIKPIFLAKSLLLYPTWHPVIKAVAPTLHVGWTLEYEVFFYFLFAVLLVFPASQRLAINLATLLLLVLLGRLVHFNSPVLQTYTGPLLLEFGAGMIVGMLYEKRHDVSPAVGLTFALISLAWMYPMTKYVDGNYRALTWGPPALLLVYGILCAERGMRKAWDLRLMELLGDSSYSIYLCHQFVLGAVRLAWKPLPQYGSAEFFLHITSGTVLATAVGVFIHLYLEKPIIKATRHIVESISGAKGYRKSIPATPHA